MKNKNYNLGKNSSASSSFTSLEEIFSNNQESILSFQNILKEHNLDLREAVQLLEQAEHAHMVPVSIFASKLSPLEALVQYFKEKGYSLKEISTLLSRSNKTIWTTYENAKKKRVWLNTDSHVRIPLEHFAKRTLSIQELVCVFLHDEKKLSLTQIAQLLAKNKNTVWTSLHRAQIKQHG